MSEKDRIYHSLLFQNKMKQDLQKQSKEAFKACLFSALKDISVLLVFVAAVIMILFSISL